MNEGDALVYVYLLDLSNENPGLIIKVNSFQICLFIQYIG